LKLFYPYVEILCMLLDEHHKSCTHFHYPESTRDALQHIISVFIDLKILLNKLLWFCLRYFETRSISASVNNGPVVLQQLAHFRQSVFLNSASCKSCIT
jgi:hypothetical protein